MKKSDVTATFATILVVLTIFYYPLSLITPLFVYAIHGAAAILLAWCLFNYRLPNSPLIIPIVTYGLLMSGVSLAGIYFSGNILHLSQIGLYLFLPISLFMAGIHTPERTLFRLVVAFLVVMFFFTLSERLEFWLGFPRLGLVEYSRLMKAAAASYGVDPTFGRASGLFVNPNQLGLFAGAALFAILSLRPPGKVPFMAVLGAMSLTLIVLSGSRGSILALALATVVYFGVGRSLRLLPAIGMGAGVLFVGYLFISANGTASFDAFIERLLPGSGEQENSLAGRLVFWSSVLRNVNLLTGTLLPPEMFLGHAIDSFYMRMLAQGGILGLLSGVFLFAGLFFATSRLAPPKAKGGFWGLLTFIAVNSLSMLGLLDFESALVWLVIGATAARLSTHPYRRRTGSVVAAP